MSITDYVVEGLKYPFNDIKKLLSFGVLFALFNLIFLFISTTSLDILRAYSALESTGINVVNISQLPASLVNMVIGLIIIGFIVCLLIMGYEWKLLKFSIDKKDELPGIYNVIDLFVNGIRYFIVVVAYNIIPTIIFVVGAMLGNGSFGIHVILLSGLFYMISYFVLIMALNNMVAYDEIKKAFDLREIFANISNIGWIKYIGAIVFTFVVYLIICAALSFVLMFVTLIIAGFINNQAIVISAILAVISGLFVSSYIGIFYNRVFGSLYNKAIEN